jgi:hypothetical protein
MNKISFFPIMAIWACMHAPYALAETAPAQDSLAQANSGGSIQDNVAVAETEQKEAPPKPAKSKEAAAQDKAVDESIRSDIIYRVNLGRADDVALLLDKGASVNETNDAGAPLIALAAARMDDEGLGIVKLLVERGADINKTDARGQNALFYAAKSGNKEVVKYLLDNKIHYTASDNVGNNARNVAYQIGHNDIVEMLDDFVRGKNDAIRKQYEEANQKLVEQYNAYTSAIEEQNKKNGIDDSQVQVSIPNSSRVRELVHDLSFASCAAAYWKFCSSAKQPTQFSQQQLDNNIATFSRRPYIFVQSLVNEFNITFDVIQKITNVSEEKINSQLSSMPDNEARRQNGVGTVDDMNSRCRAIAGMWKTWAKTVDTEQNSNQYRNPQYNTPYSNQVPGQGNRPRVPSLW